MHHTNGFKVGTWPKIDTDYLYHHLFICLFCLFSTQANALLIRASDGMTVTDLAAESGVVLEVNEPQNPLDLDLLAAYNVPVFGLELADTYDVVFRDGTFLNIFGDESQLDALTFTQSLDYSSALNLHVFLDVTQVYAFDSNPFMTIGCENTNGCHAVTPYDLIDNGFNVVSTSAFNNLFNNPDSVQNNLLHPVTDDYLSETLFVWADWSLSSTRLNQVPTPGGLALLVLGLLGLGWRRKA